MRSVKKEEGFTLVEVLVAVSILTIIIFAFTTLFTTSFTGIFGAGRKSEALFKAQEEMDNAIAQGLDESLEEKTLVINFDLKTFSIRGREKHINYEYEGRTGTLYYLIPQGN